MQLPEGARQTVLQQALQEAAALPLPGGADVLIRVALLLPGEAQRTALLRALEAIAAGSWPHPARLARLARALAQADAALLQEAIRRAGTMPDGSALSQQALTVALRVQESTARIAALTAMAGVLQGEARDRALEQALAAALGIVQGSFERITALCAVTARLEGSARRQALEEALAATAALPMEILRGTALCAVAACAAPDREALQAVVEAAARQDERFRAGTLGEIARHVAADRALLQRLLEAALGTSHAPDRARTLTELGAQLQGDARSAVLSQALDTLGALAVHLEGPMQRTVARRVLCASLLRQDPARLTYDLWTRLLEPARLTRPQLLMVLGPLTGCAVALSGRAQEAQEIAAAIHEVCACFP